MLSRPKVAIANWGRRTPLQSFSAIITTPCQVWSHWTYSVFAADTLLYAVTLTFDPLTLNVRGTSSITWSNLSEQSPAESLIILWIFARCDAVNWSFDLTSWPWTFTSMYQIWAKWNNPRLSYLACYHPAVLGGRALLTDVRSRVCGCNFTILKLAEWCSRFLDQLMKVYLRPNLWNTLFDGHTLRGCWAWYMDKERKTVHR